MDRRMISFLAVGIAALLLLAAALLAWRVRLRNLAPGARDRAVLKLAHGLPPAHPVHRGMEFMAQRLAEKSGGAMRLQVIDSGKLGSEDECLELLQSGALAMTKVSTAVMENFVPEFAVFGVPYVFTDEAQYWRVLEGPLGRELLAAGQSKGLRGLCYYDAGSRSFYTVSRPILQPDDLKGLKIRVQRSRTAMDMVEALGGAPTPVPWGELYTALQQGMVDGAENNPPSLWTSRHFEVCKHYALNEHTMVPDILVVSTSAWQKLSAQGQRWLQEAADESGRHQRRLWQDETRTVLGELEKRGVTIHRPDKAPFVAKVQAMHRSYDGTPVGRMLQRIRETKESP